MDREEKSEIERKTKERHKRIRSRKTDRLKTTEKIKLW
jgi:hypothetical protein